MVFNAPYFENEQSVTLAAHFNETKKTQTCLKPVKELFRLPGDWE